MYNDLNSTMHFSHEQDGVVTSKTLNNKETWIEHLQEFLYFLESCGYEGVRKRVAIDTGVFSTDEIGWYGVTFDAEESEVPINTEADALSGDTPKSYKDDWIDWDGQLEGEELPYGLDATEEVIVKCRFGSEYRSKANHFGWGHSGENYDIIAYKVI